MSVQNQNKIKSATEKQEESLKSMKDMMVADLEGFSLATTSSQTVANPKSKGKAKPKPKAGSGLHPVVVASQFRSQTARSLIQAEALAKQAKSMASGVLQDPGTTDEEKDSERFRLIDCRSSALRILLGDEISTVTGPTDDPPGKVVATILQTDQYFAEMGLHEDYIDTLAVIKYTRAFV